MRDGDNLTLMASPRRGGGATWISRRRGTGGSGAPQPERAPQAGQWAPTTSFISTKTFALGARERSSIPADVSSRRLSGRAGERHRAITAVPSGDQVDFRPGRRCGPGGQFEQRALARVAARAGMAVTRLAASWAIGGRWNFYRRRACRVQQPTTTSEWGDMLALVAGSGTTAGGHPKGSGTDRR